MVLRWFIRCSVFLAWTSFLPCPWSDSSPWRDHPPIPLPLFLPASSNVGTWRALPPPRLPWLITLQPALTFPPMLHWWRWEGFSCHSCIQLSASCNGAYLNVLVALVEACFADKLFLCLFMKGHQHPTASIVQKFQHELAVHRLKTWNMHLISK